MLVQKEKRFTENSQKGEKCLCCSLVSGSYAKHGAKLEFRQQDLHTGFCTRGFDISLFMSSLATCLTYTLGTVHLLTDDAHGSLVHFVSLVSRQQKRFFSFNQANVYLLLTQSPLANISACGSLFNELRVGDELLKIIVQLYIIFTCCFEHFFESGEG